MNFKELPIDKLRAAQEKGRRNRRSPKHQWAYSHKEIIRKEYEQGTNISHLAKKYETSRRTIYRWIME